MTEQQPIQIQPWHRLFGLSLVDFFHGLPVDAELEKDLSLKQQLLDVVIIRRDATPLPRRLPDGFEDLAAHNLVSFKSYQESMDGWTLNELIGHYVNYRKQISPSMKRLLPEADFRLFAVSVRMPQNLARRGELTRVQTGVYEVQHFTGPIRLIVVHELPQEPHNAMFHVLSGRLELAWYGLSHYEMHSEETSTLLAQFIEKYRSEETFMPDLMKELARETLPYFFKNIPPEEILKWVSAKELVKKIPPEELLKWIPAEELLKGLSPDDLISALSPETLAGLAQRLKANGSATDTGSK